MVTLLPVPVFPSDTPRYATQESVPSFHPLSPLKFYAALLNLFSFKIVSLIWGGLAVIFDRVQQTELSTFPLLGGVLNVCSSNMGPGI